MSLLHKLTHLLGWNYGRVEVWWSGLKLMVGFKCDGCGKIQDAHEVKRP